MSISEIASSYQRRGCHSTVDSMSLCHMLVLYHVSAVITQMFYSNFIPVKYDQPLTVIFFFIWTIAWGWCSYFSTLMWPQNVILLLFEICIIYHKGITFHKSYLSRENLQTFFLFSQELIFTEKSSSHILRELNLANFVRKVFYMLQ